MPWVSNPFNHRVGLVDQVARDVDAARDSFERGTDERFAASASDLFSVASFVDSQPATARLSSAGRRKRGIHEAGFAFRSASPSQAAKSPSPNIRNMTPKGIHMISPASRWSSKASRPAADERMA